MSRKTWFRDLKAWLLMIMVFGQSMILAGGLGTMVGYWRVGRLSEFWLLDEAPKGLLLPPDKWVLWFHAFSVLVLALVFGSEALWPSTSESED